MKQTNICRLSRDIISVAQPSIRLLRATAPRVTLRELKLVYTTEIYLRTTKLALLYGLWTLTTTYELRNVTHETRARWIARNSVAFFRRLWTKVYQCACAREIACSLQRRFTCDDILFLSGDMRDQVAKLSEICHKFRCLRAW